MRYLSALLAAATFPVTNAWSMELIQYGWDSRGVFHYDSGDSFPDRDMNEGCAQRNLPDFVTLCMDYKQKRGHFITDDGRKNYKYCLRQAYHMWVRGGDPRPDQGGMFYGRWEPTDCTWRIPGNESITHGDPKALLVAPASGLGDQFKPFIPKP